MLELSTRAYNALKRRKIEKVQELVDKTEGDLLAIRNLGAKTAAEIASTVRAYLAASVYEKNGSAVREETATAPEREEARSLPDGLDKIAIETLGLSVRSFNCLKKAKIDTVQQLMELSSEELLAIRNLGKKSLEELESLRRKYRLETSPAPKAELTPEELAPLVLKAFRVPFQGLSYREIRDALPEGAGEDAVKRAVGKLLAEHELEYVDLRCYRVAMSFYAFLEASEGLFKDRDYALLKRRYQGETLEAIAKDYDLTRERVRQIQKKLQDKLAQAYRKQSGLSYFDEDYYVPLYTSCDLPDAFWLEELSLSREALNYLDFSYKHGTADPESILQDERIPISLRYRVQNYLDRDKVRIDGQLIERRRADLEELALRKFAQDELEFGKYVELYNGMLQSAGVPFDERLYYTDEVLNSRKNRFADSLYCLWKQGSKIRYYDIPSRDYTELLETLHLDSYHDTGISTKKFMELYPRLMEEYDIRDQYELHNLLKKIQGRCGLDQITFDRQPGLVFGTFDRVKAITEIIEILSPITAEELADYVYQEFGFDGGMIPYTALKQYYHHGVYSMDFKRIPEQRADALMAALKDEFYYFDEIKQRYLALFPDADPEEINPYSLKGLGFQVNSNYAFRGYPSSEAYFTALLTKDDVYSTKDYFKRYGSIMMFSQVYAKLLQSHRLFRFERDAVISLRRLERFGVTLETIEDYCAAVQRSVEQESYFTVQSLRLDGFTHPLDQLGFEDYFYASLLGADARFSSQRVFGNVVLYNGRVFGQFSIADFIRAQLADYDVVSEDTFIQDIQDRFGVVIGNRAEIVEAVKGTDFYYDRIMQKIYREKSLYYADLDD